MSSSFANCAHTTSAGASIHAEANSLIMPSSLRRLVHCERGPLDLRCYDRADNGAMSRQNGAKECQSAVGTLIRVPRACAGAPIESAPPSGRYESPRFQTNRAWAAWFCTVTAVDTHADQTALHQRLCQA